MKRNSQKLVWVMIFSLIFSVVADVGPILKAQSNNITINNVEEFINFAENCTLDTWSKGKNIILMTDIDLSEVDFKSIPIFSGSFDGNNHTITGLNIVNSGTVEGLFRYVQQGAIIKNLTIKGNVVPSGSKKNVGGIVGSNAGTIKDCSFIGVVGGDSYIGGIVGINEPEGKVINCLTLGTVYGEHYIGGIAGENLGTILNSKNKMNVNTLAKDIDITLDDLQNISFDQLNSTENTTLITDIGGIAGFSTGIIQGCQNYGPVGYQHIGYNIGGIVGRQSGYLAECSNYGEVYGRKDVGGIAGQIEPYITLEYSVDKITRLRTELNKLNNLMDQTILDVEGYNSDVTAHINTLKGHIDTAIDTTTDIVNQTENLLNESVDSVNEVSSRISSTLEKLEPALEEAQYIGDDMIKATDKLQAALVSLEDVSDEGKKTIKAINKTLDSLDTTIESLIDAVESVSHAMKIMKSALGDIDEMKHALNMLKQSFADLADGLGNISKAFTDISKGLDKLKESIKADEKLDSLIEDFSEMGVAFKEMTTAINQIMLALDEKYTQDIFASLEAATQSFLNATVHFKDALLVIDIDNIESMDKVVSDFKEVTKSTDDILDAMDVTRHEFIGCTDDLKTVAERVHHIASDIYEIVSDLADKPTITLPNLDSNYMENTNQLSITMGDISNAIGDMSDMMGQHNDVLLDHLKDISDQFFVITNLLIDIVSKEENENKEISDYKQDISDTDTEDNTQGKIAECINEGKIEGDINIGGIAGSMAIEYDFDPEDDITAIGTSSFNFEYLASAVIRNSTNKGEIISKKDYVGGIVGRMDLGTVISSQGYGKITSNDGDYVGGIAGASDSHIKDSFAMCILSGGSNIGGIAGFASKLTNNYAMIELEQGIESIGAIAGNVEAISNVNKNYFVEGKLAGVDGISYTSKAEPISYEAFCKVDKLPEAFINLKLTFVVDEKVIAEMPFVFGDTIDKNDLPEIPQKQGCYGKWPEFDYETLTFSQTLEAEYIPYTTVLTSSLTRDGKSCALVEGAFDENTVLNMMEVDVAPPSKIGDETKIWSVVINGRDYKNANTYDLRFLKASKGKTKVFALQQDDSWKELSTKDNGSYVIVEMKGSTGVFCVTGISYTKQIICFVSLIVSVILVFIVKFINKKKGLKVISQSINEQEQDIL